MANAILGFISGHSLSFIDNKDFCYPIYGIPTGKRGIKKQYINNGSAVGARDNKTVITGSNLFRSRSNRPDRVASLCRTIQH